MEKSLPVTQPATSTDSNDTMKYVSLIVLVAQNSSLALIMRLSRTWSDTMYFATTAVVLSEVLKVFISLFVLFSQTQYSVIQLRTLLVQELVNKPWESVKMLVPAVLYTIQNNLAFIAASNLSAATYQVTYQIKILTTALFAVIILRKALDAKKWLSLAILAIGVGLVQISEQGITQTTKAVSDNVGNSVVGLVAVLAACFTSGFAGIYFEKIIKQEKANEHSIWLRNIQLGGFGIVIGIIGAFLKDGTGIIDLGFFYGYNWIVWCVILDSALGGLIVAIVVKYADNILKGFATSVSIIVSSIISILLLNFVPSLQWVLGAFFVIVATVLYST